MQELIPAHLQPPGPAGDAVPVDPSPAPPVPRVNRDITRCSLRGDYIDTVACATCAGAINLPAFECLLHGEDQPRLCTLERPAVDAAIQWCRTCTFLQQKVTASDRDSQ